MFTRIYFDLIGKGGIPKFTLESHYVKYENFWGINEKLYKIYNNHSGYLKFFF